MTSPILTESGMFSLKFTRALLLIVPALTAIYAPPATAEGAIESAGSNEVVLTADERSFLNNHDLGCAMAPNWPPINMYDQDQKLMGVAIDFWEHISNNLGIDVKCDIKDSFSEVTEAIKNRESDFMLATSLTEARKDYAVFSKPYATLPIAIASTVDRGYMPDQSVLVGQRVAVGRGYSAYEILSRSHPDIEFVEVDNTDAGLQMLSEGEVFAVVDSLPVLNWLIKKNNYRNVKVSGITNYNIDLRLMIRSDYPLLGVIFNKGIDLISEQERKQALSRWFADQPTISNNLEDSRVVLTPEEQSWLKEHPNIALGYTDAFEPEVIVNPDGSHSGILVDFLEALNKRLGTSITLRIDSIPGLLKKAKTKEVDGILEIHPEYADKLGLLKSVGYLSAYPAVFARQNVSFAGPDDFTGKKIAIIDKIYFTEEMVRQYGKQATIQRVKDAIQGLKSVSNGDADLFVGVSFNSYYITKYQLFDVVTKYVFDDFTDKFGMAVRPDWPELIPILNKGIASFSQNEIDTIVSKWSYLPQQEKTVELTSEEQAWLDQNHTVQVRVVNIPPYIILKKGADPEGISIDYLNLIAERTGVKFKYVFSGKSFSEALDGLNRHQGLDLITSMMRTPEREKSILFSNDYVRSPYVIFTHTDDKVFINDIADLHGKKIAVPKGTVIHNRIKSEYPDLNLVLFDNDIQAIEAVSTGKTDAYIGNLTLASFLILEKGLLNIKIAGPSPFGDHVFSMAIRNDWPELASIVDKGLASISPEDQAEIRNKYISIEYAYTETAVIIKWFLIIGGAASGIVFLFLFWNWQLRRKVRLRTVDLEEEVVERTRAEEALRDSELRFRSLIEQSPVSIQIHGPGGELIQSNPAYANLYTLNDETLAWLYEKYNVLEDKQARQLGLMPFIERVYKGEDVVFPPYEYNGIDTLKSLDANNPVSRICWVKTLGFPLKDELGRVTSLVFMSENITEQMHATDELRISESCFRATFEQAAVGIAHVSPEGHFLRINQKFCDIVDYSRDKMLKLTFQEITYSQDLNTDMEVLNRLLSGEIDTYSLEKRYIRKDGALVWVNLTVSLVRDDADNPLWFVAVVQDISERKMAEQVIQDYQRRLRKLAARLARTEQMERRNLALELHDNVGQSLAVMRLQLAAARKDTGGSKADKILSEVSSSLREAIVDTRDIISNLSSPMLSELGLSAALAEYLLVKIGERYNLETRFSDDDEPKPTNLETNQILYRSVRELLINVVKHANADLVTIDISRRKGDIQIVVEDNGKGETVERLPKQKTEEGGFGLFSIEERMQDIGGSLMIENVSGQGFRATLRAPLNPE